MKNVIRITESKLKDIIKESVIEMLNEAQTLVDNFDDIAKHIDSIAQANNDPDMFWFIEVKKRYKDNPGLHSKIRGNHRLNYDGYGLYLGSFRVHNGQELMQLKSQIVDLCNKNNARAYITLNPRSHKAVQSHVNSPRFRSYARSKAPNANPEDISSGRAVNFFGSNGKKMSRQEVIDTYGSDRPYFMFDIDEKDERVWNLTRMVLNHFNIDIAAERKTASGGLHIVCSNAFDPNLDKALEYLRIFDVKIDSNGVRNYFPKPRDEQERRKQVVGCDYDGKELLYSNVVTKGY